MACNPNAEGLYWHPFNLRRDYRRPIPPFARHRLLVAPLAARERGARRRRPLLFRRFASLATLNTGGRQYHFPLRRLEPAVKGDRAGILFWRRGRRPAKASRRNAIARANQRTGVLLKGAQPSPP